MSLNWAGNWLGNWVGGWLGQMGSGPGPAPDKPGYVIMRAKPHKVETSIGAHSVEIRAEAMNVGIGALP